MDVHLPGIDGLEASRRMLDAGETQRPVILLLSTDEPGEYADDPMECGAAAYLAKAEFGSESLSAAWAAAIELHLWILSRLLRRPRTDGGALAHHGDDLEGATHRRHTVEHALQSRPRVAALGVETGPVVGHRQCQPRGLRR